MTMVNLKKWTVTNVWWGKKPLMMKDKVPGIAGCTSMDLFHPKKLFIRQLTKITTDVQVEVRRAQLERAFAKYGGARGVTVVAPKKKSFAFVKFECATQAAAALCEMAVHFNVARAKYTRPEALEAKRAAAAATSRNARKRPAATRTAV